LTPEQLLARIESSGVSLAAEGGRLRVSAPKGGLTEELKSSISMARDTLIALLERRAAARAAVIERVDRSAPLRVSSFQERLWILQQMDRASSAYNMVHVWENTAGSDASRVVAAIRTLVERHEILRSAFVESQGKLVARVLPVDSVAIGISDLTSLEPAEARRHIDAEMASQVERAFDLQAAPPVRFTVFRLPGNRVATLLAAHHIAVDDWSLSVLEKEIAVACSPGGVPAEAPRLQYCDFAAWQRKTADPTVIAADLEWWARYLARAPQLSLFPSDLRGPGDTSVTSPVGATHTVVWSQDLAAGVRSLARTEGATLYMAMLAACALVLRWHTGQEDFVFGSPMGARERTELETMIGPFVNLLLVRVDVSGEPTFAELLRRVRGSMLEAHERRHVPFETLLETLKPARSLAYSPLFQMALVQHNAPEEGGGGKLRRAGGAMHEITWFARETAAGLECSFEYRADLYSAAAIDRIAAQIENLLQRAVDSPMRRFAELALLPSVEAARLDSFNATAASFGRTIFAAQLERSAAATPTAVALAFESVALTYADLNGRANQLAHALRAAGVRPGVRVALCLERSPTLVVALLAIQKAGGAYVPLDPGFPTARLSFMLADSGATVLLTASGAADSVEVPEQVAVIDLTDASELAERPSVNLAPEAQPEDAAYVIYTSGSTGRPKGVEVSHGALMNLLCSMTRVPGLSAADRLAAVTTVSFDIAGLELYLPLCVGARIELVARETAADGPALAELLNERGVTVLQATPATWRLLIDAGWRARPGFRAFCGGEALSAELAAQLLESGAELWNLYGPTETTIWSTCERVEPDTGITIGRPIANTRVYVVSSAGSLQPIGVPGEIWIGGEGVARGYLGRPELTSERFVADRFGKPAAGRLYRTGDLGRWRDDGRLEHLGRLDHQVKIRGFRIELGEVEAALASLEGVRQSIVVAHDAAASDRRLVAYVVYEPGADFTVSEVRRHLRTQLPDYMIPSLVVAIDTVPLTPNGKVDRAALPDPFRNVTSAATDYEPPATQMERLLATVWSDVLQVEKVGLNDNFFDLGGHSLLSLRVVAAVEARSGWRMDPRTLFFQTLRQIALTGTGAGQPVEYSG
jgi:amino acid adenylation domain-containing protein